MHKRAFIPPDVETTYWTEPRMIFATQTIYGHVLTANATCAFALLLKQGGNNVGMRESLPLSKMLAQYALP